MHMWGLMNKILLSCMDATKLSVQKSFRVLSLREKLQLNMHHKMCHACRKFDSQNVFIDHALKKYYAAESSNEEKELSQPVKDTLTQAIKESSH